MVQSSSFIHTKAASEILRVSVGTIQKLVDNGEIHSFRTQGGHRRIAVDSIKDYCKKHFIPIYGQSNNKEESNPSIFIIHKKNDLSPEMEKICKDKSLKTITDPLELFNLQNGEKTIFIDSRISWINWLEIDFKKTMFSQCRTFIYNAELFSHNEAQHLESQFENQIQLVHGDISSDFLSGYLLFHKKISAP